MGDKNYADEEAVAWDDRRQSEADEMETLEVARAGAEETRTNDYGTADVVFGVTQSGAELTLALKNNQAEFDRQSALAGEENSLTTGALGFVGQFVSDVATGINNLYTAYHAGNADQAAVSNVWTQFTINAAAPWTAFADAESNSWLKYVNDTIADWKTMADNIANAASNIIPNLVPEYQTLVSTIASGQRTYSNNMAGAVKLRNQTVSTAVLGATQSANTAALALTNARIGLSRTHDDQIVNDTRTALGEWITRCAQFIVDMANTSLPFRQWRRAGQSGSDL